MKQKLYLYAMTPACDGERFGPIGLNGGDVYATGNSGVSAVVGEVPNILRPERRLLAQHQQVLKHLMENVSAVLPVAFGVVAQSQEAIRGILSHNRGALLANLRRVSGRVEMGLKVAWDVPNIFQYFVETQPELRAARDRLFGGNGEPTQEDKLELGRLFDQFLTGEREAHAERVMEKLRPACAEIRPNKPRGEREVSNLACLVARDRLEEFEKAVLEAANLFDNCYSFDYNGPWAPHNFVDVALDLDAMGAGGDRRHAAH